MEYVFAVGFALVQAVTEFVPISSSGHLVLLHALFPQAIHNEALFDVVLHAGTLFATIAYFRQDIIRIARALLQQAVHHTASDDAKLGWLVLVSSVPAAAIGFFFEDIIEQVLRSPWVVVSMLVAVALAMLAVERVARQINDERRMGWRLAVGIGCAQALALVPGTSRSGATIIAGMAGGLKREAAVRFSFLMSLPIVAGATAVKVPDIAATTMPLGVLGIGFITAVGAGWFVIHYLMRYVRGHALDIFAYYRLALAAVVVLWLIA